MVQAQNCFNPQVFGDGDEVEDFDEGEVQCEADTVDMAKPFSNILSDLGF